MAAAVSPLSYEKELAAVAKLLLLLPLMLMLLLLLRSLKKLVSARIFFQTAFLAILTIPPKPRDAQSSRAFIYHCMLRS